MKANAILNFTRVNSQKSANAQLKSEYASLTSQSFSQSHNTYFNCMLAYFLCAI